ncbi:hypothetical protein VTN31DRAFT_5847 [Thermomyces dupontii]|uniref:uncharacterized protein n=1 Tax=Talaromyces thermophilus TaxID=28565 RepID=UPI003743E4CD
MLKSARGMVGECHNRPITRANMEYRVEPVDGTNEAAALFVRDRQERWSVTGGKIIVFTNDARRAEVLAKILGCHSFNDAMSKPRKDQVLEDFTQAGGGAIIVATPDLAVCLKVAAVRCVIHLDIPTSLHHYVQESARAGRDGQPSEAVIIAPPGSRPREWDTWDPELMRGIQAMKRYVRGEKCRRQVLDSYLGCYERDGGCLNSLRELLCDVCKATSESMVVDHASSVENDALSDSCD